MGTKKQREKDSLQSSSLPVYIIVKKLALSLLSRRQDKPDTIQVVATIQETLDFKSEILVLFPSRFHDMQFSRELSSENITKV